MTTDLLKLAERCEEATEADRELNALIWCALRGVKYRGHNVAYQYMDRDNPLTQVEFTEPPKRSVRVSGSSVLPHALPYTASLDAAMTLVPEGWGWLVSQPNEKAIASGLLKERTPVLGEVQYGCEQRYAVAAATPALALCAAALRARAALQDVG